VIRLHRLSARAEVFHLNPDLILTIESTPDTLVTLTTHAKLMVTETPEDVVTAVQAWRSSILAAAMPTPRRRSEAGLTLVAASVGTPAPDHHEEGDR
jgi:flagellar protein FlbD